jgi:pilus assembly protein CpaB
MANRNNLIAVAVGLLCGATAFYFLYQKASEIEQKTTPVQILVAGRYIPPGSYLKADMVERKTIPEAFVSPSALRDIKEVDGLLSLVPLSAGEQVLSNKFGVSEESLAFVLEPGYRAYTLEVNETSGVGNLLRPGNHVDVMAKISSEKREMTTFALQNLRILATGQKLDWNSPSKQNPDSISSGTGENVNAYSTVTLAVSPEQAEVLMYLEGHALRLVLRPTNDTEETSIPPKTENDILTKLGQPSRKIQSRPIEIIRGNSKQGE